MNIGYDAAGKSALKRSAVIIVLAVLGMYIASVLFPDNQTAFTVSLFVLLAVVVAALAWSMTEFQKATRRNDRAKHVDPFIEAYHETHDRRQLLKDCEEFFEGPYDLDLRIEVMEQVANELIDGGYTKDARRVIAMMTKRNILGNSGNRKLAAAAARCEERMKAK
jgi:ABC-type nickel/cobalt efflux system permease component RcnA